MSDKTTVHRNSCRLTVVKIVDSGPIPSNNTDNEESDIDEQRMPTKEPVTRQSPQQKRPISPATLTNLVNNKKVKLEQSKNDNKKNQEKSVIKNENISETTVINKKTKLASHKSSSSIEGKSSKTISVTESNQTIGAKNNTKNPNLTKLPVSTKLLKSQSTNDIKSFAQTAVINNKRKELVVSPTKTKPISNMQNGLKKTVNKNSSKVSLKTEQPSTSMTKSPSKLITKQETLSKVSSSNVPASNTKPLMINNRGKISKKSAAPSITEKCSRSSMLSASSNRNSIRDSQGQPSLSSKTQPILKRQSSLSSINNKNSSSQSEKRNTSQNYSKHQSSKSSHRDQSHLLTSSPHQSLSKHSIPTPPEFINSPSQFQLDVPINCTVSSSSSSSSSIDASQPSITISPFTYTFQNENNCIQSAIHIDKKNDDNNIQLSDRSNSSDELSPVQSIKIASNRLSRSDESDTNDSDASMDDDNEEEDLLSILTNDDLRYKLIHIYKRFQLNSANDLVIFVRFFKRHQLVDLSSLATTKTTNDVFTYDLFSLSPSLIGELASDLGYKTASITGSIEQQS